MSSRSLLVCQRSFGGQKQVVRNDQQHDAQGREQHECEVHRSSGTEGMDRVCRPRPLADGAGAA